MEIGRESGESVEGRGEKAKKKGLPSTVEAV